MILLQNVCVEILEDIEWGIDAIKIIQTPESLFVRYGVEFLCKQIANNNDTPYNEKGQ
ncbi:hypothetical protein NB640_03630 [Oxalobacter vibrioformis]|uniref:Uncharacterized protein n=1 Tax=Oxalobacter vibrioformis TaxID=933080 RepID=A0A9E9LY02_9BURK|nr:hypothetical protein [Oxalobacter vibrioformis]WAW10757.1 hypothetical protein NB640_03630 [Oxalobacter vibrioformis]